MMMSWASKNSSVDDERTKRYAWVTGDVDDVDETDDGNLDLNK